MPHRYPSARKAIALLCVIFCAAFAVSQQPATGAPSFGSFAGGPDTINLANLNTHLSIPIFHRAGRGIPFDYSLTYDSLIWVPTPSGSSAAWVPQNELGMAQLHGGAATGWVKWTNLDDTPCTSDFNGYIYHDPNGGLHPFKSTVVHVYYYFHGTGCPLSSQHIPYSGSANDNSGYYLSPGRYGTTTVLSRGGVKLVAPVSMLLGSGSLTDSNGNVLTVNYTSSTQVNTKLL